MYSRKSYPIGFLFTQKNGCGGAISVTERSWAAPISKVEPHISERFCAILWWGSFGAVLTSIGSCDGNVS